MPLPLRCRFEAVDRLVQGLSALFLALRRRPVIRYQRSSDAAKRLAEGLHSLTYKQQVRGWAHGMPYNVANTLPVLYIL